MKCALMIIEDTGGPLLNRAAVRDFVNDIAALKLQTAQVERLNEGTYIVRLENGLTALKNLLHQAEHRSLRTRTLFFDQEPPFVITSPS